MGSPPDVKALTEPADAFSCRTSDRRRDRLPHGRERRRPLAPTSFGGHRMPKTAWSAVHSLLPARAGRRTHTTTERPPRGIRGFAALAAAASVAVLAVPASASAATFYVSTSGSDSSPCSSLAPCASFSRGYGVAAPGDTVLVAAGKYGNQRIDDVPAKDATGVAQITIQPAAGASVTIGDLLSFASNVRYSGFTVDLNGGGQPDVRGGHDVTVENARATNFYVQGPTSNVTIKGGEYGPYVTEGGGSHIKTLTAGGDDPNSAVQPKNTVVDGAYFHDYSVPPGSSAHLDCLHVFYHVGVTIKNSRFERCEHYGILLGSNGSTAAEHDVVQNNFFKDSQVAGFA